MDHQLMNELPDCAKIAAHSRGAAARSSSSGSARKTWRPAPRPRIKTFPGARLPCGRPAAACISFTPSTVWLMMACSWAAVTVPRRPSANCAAES